MKSDIKDLCFENTNLKQDDIDKLNKIAENLPLFSELFQVDIFIDCLTRDKDVAIVLAESKKPSNSLYTSSVVQSLAYRKNEPAVLRTLNTGISSTDLKAITQENKTVRQNAVAIKNDLNNIIGVLIEEKDVTDDINQDKNLKILSETNEQLTETLIHIKKNHDDNTLNYLNDAIIIFNQKGKAIYVNPAAEQLYQELGYKDEIKGMSFKNLVLDNSEFQDALSCKSPRVCEIELGKLVLEIKYAVTNKRNNDSHLIMLLKDITEVKEKDKQLILKSVVIKEIHHRLKNNLQTVASILRLQSRSIDNQEVKRLFEESINRVLSISATHEILAQNGVDEVDIKNIIVKVKENILCLTKSSKTIIGINVKGDSFNIDSDKSTSIALVVNELLQNSIEHGFNERDTGNIEINIRKGILYSSISIIDDGIGFNPEILDNGSLGLRIVKNIVKDKLEGNINIESENRGTKIYFDFKNNI
jgi:two-component system, sensor histidine kinase PdtaS